jgi:bifunctional phosphoglucose/phosphomannose isomerase
MPPRTAIAYLFFPLLRTLSKSGIISNKDKEVEETISITENFEDKKAKAVAENLKGKIPVIYASKKYAPLTYRLKTQINENSKEFSVANVFSEINHNEIEANLDSRFFLVLFRDSKEDKRIAKQIEAFKKIIKVKMSEINLKGKSYLAKIFYGIYFSDWLSYHLARLKKVDMMKTERIDKIKKMIRKR